MSVRKLTPTFRHADSGPRYSPKNRDRVLVVIVLTYPDLSPVHPSLFRPIERDNRSLWLQNVTRNVSISPAPTPPHRHTAVHDGKNVPKQKIPSTFAFRFAKSNRHSKSIHIWTIRDR